ncbi:hypothetical protein BBJ28_00003599 [Nothophytophthora sp. Chile5]|nr:hypothetical protein BBJ28_00003599 [Nothophytophthora sp. Chile5]
MAELFDAAALTLELSDGSSEELLDALLFHDLELGVDPEDGGEAVDPASTLLSHDWLEDEAIQAPVALQHEGGDEDEEAAATSNASAAD